MYTSNGFLPVALDASEFVEVRRLCLGTQVAICDKLAKRLHQPPPTPIEGTWSFFRGSLCRSWDSGCGKIIWALNINQYSHILVIGIDEYYFEQTKNLTRQVFLWRDRFEKQSSQCSQICLVPLMSYVSICSHVFLCVSFMCLLTPHELMKAFGHRGHFDFSPKGA